LPLLVGTRAGSNAAGFEAHFSFRPVRRSRKRASVHARPLRLHASNSLNCTTNFRCALTVESKYILKFVYRGLEGGGSECMLEASQLRAWRKDMQRCFKSCCSCTWGTPKHLGGYEKTSSKTKHTSRLNLEPRSSSDPRTREDSSPN
jgi:hypothetical protein